MFRQILATAIILANTGLYAEEPPVALDDLLEIGLQDPSLTRGLLPAPAEIVKQCTEKLRVAVMPERVARLYECRAVAQRIMRNRSAALSDVLEAHKRLPSDARICCLYAEIHLAEQKIAAAKQVVEQLIASKPRHAPAYVARARVAMRYPGGSLSAITATTYALELDVDLADAYYVRGLAHLMTGGKETALRDIQMSLKLGAGQSYVLSELPDLTAGQILISLGRHNEATQALQRAHTINPQSFPVARSMWQNYSLAQQGSHAAIAARAMHELAPDHRSTQVAMAIMHTAKGDYDSAVAYWRAYRDLGARGANLLVLALAENRVGEYEAAARIYDEIDQSPDGSDVAKLAHGIFLFKCRDPRIQDRVRATRIADELLRQNALDDRRAIPAILILYASGHRDRSAAYLKQRYLDLSRDAKRLQQKYDSLTEDMKAGKQIPVPDLSIEELIGRP